MFSIKRVFQVEPSKTMAIFAIVATIVWVSLSWLWWPRMPVTVPTQPLAFPRGPSLQGDYFEDVKYSTLSREAASGQYTEKPRTITVGRSSYGYSLVIQALRRDGEKKVVVQIDNVVNPGLAYFFYAVNDAMINDDSLLIEVIPNTPMVISLEGVIAMVWLVCFYCCFGEWRKAATGKTS
jgi:hypothetical protein